MSYSFWPCQIGQQTPNSRAMLLKRKYPYTNQPFIAGGNSGLKSILVYKNTSFEFVSNSTRQILEQKIFENIWPCLAKLATVHMWWWLSVLHHTKNFGQLSHHLPPNVAILSHKFLFQVYVPMGTLSDFSADLVTYSAHHHFLMRQLP